MTNHDVTGRLFTKTVQGQTVVFTPSGHCLSVLHLDLLAFADSEGICFSTVDTDKIARDELVKLGLLSEKSWLITDIGRAAVRLAKENGLISW